MTMSLFSLIPQVPAIPKYTRRDDPAAEEPVIPILDDAKKSVVIVETSVKRARFQYRCAQHGSGPLAKTSRSSS